MIKADRQAVDSSHGVESEKVAFDPPGLTGRVPVPNGEMLVVRDVPAAFCSIVAAILGQSPRSRRSIALSGGPTAKKCYEALSAYSVSSCMDWSGVAIFMSDERCVPMDHPDSNSGMVRETLVAKIGKLGAFHPMDCVAGPEAYSSIISGVLPFDLIHLGMDSQGRYAISSAHALHCLELLLAGYRKDGMAGSVDRRQRESHAIVGIQVIGIAR